MRPGLGLAVEGQDPAGIEREDRPAPLAGGEPGRELALPGLVADERQARARAQPEQLVRGLTGQGLGEPALSLAAGLEQRLEQLGGLHRAHERAREHALEAHAEARQAGDLVGETRAALGRELALGVDGRAARGPVADQVETHARIRRPRGLQPPGYAGPGLPEDPWSPLMGVMMPIETARDLCRFIDAAPSPFHAVAECARRLEAAGFRRIDERDAWELGGGRHYAVRGASLVAWASAAGAPPERGFRVVGAHTDSPNLRIKARPEHGLAPAGASWRSRSTAARS